MLSLGYRKAELPVGTQRCAHHSLRAQARLRKADRVDGETAVCHDQEDEIKLLVGCSLSDARLRQEHHTLACLW